MPNFNSMIKKKYTVNKTINNKTEKKEIQQEKTTVKCENVNLT